MNNCSHNWLITWNKSLRDYSIERESNSKAVLPAGKLVKIFPARCKSYSCPICGRKKVFDLLDRLKGVNLKGYRFFTLTLKSGNNLDDTEKNLLRITKHFNELNKRLRKIEKYKKLEYFRVVEIGKKSGMIHMHGIWNIYIPIGKLSQMWQNITGDSYRVALARIKRKEDCLNYLFKYLTKDVANSDLNYDPALFNLDIKNAAAIFYENGKRRWQSSRNFFNKQYKKKSDFIPYYFESEEPACIERTIGYLKKEYDLKREHFDLDCYYESDLYLQNLFDPDG